MLGSGLFEFGFGFLSFFLCSLGFFISSVLFHFHFSSSLVILVYSVYFLYLDVLFLPAPVCVLILFPRYTSRQLILVKYENEYEYEYERIVRDFTPLQLYFVKKHIFQHTSYNKNYVLTSLWSRIKVRHCLKNLMLKSKKYPFNPPYFSTPTFQLPSAAKQILFGTTLSYNKVSHNGSG